METATSALRSAPPPGSVANGGVSARRSAKASRSTPSEAYAGEPAGLDVGRDEIAVGDDEEDALRRRAAVGRSGPSREDLEVEHCLVDRDRQRLLGAEANGVGELLRIVDAGDLDRADADAVVGEADADVALRQLVLPEELLERLAERLDLAHLAAGDRRLEAAATPASCTTSVEPFTETHAALSREAPSLSPTTFFATVAP